MIEKGRMWWLRGLIVHPVGCDDYDIYHITAEDVYNEN